MLNPPIPTAPQPTFELGIYSFVERTPDPQTGALVSPTQRMQDLLETIELADQVGLDLFAIGEHHRPDYVSSSPVPILAAGAARTKSMRFSSAVTVLSADDPVRVFQSFATLDLISQGRAEIMAGRGSFTESFPLFGYDQNDYNSLFIEKLDLLMVLRDNEIVTWSGNHRTPLNEAGIYPRPHQEKIPIWIAVGSSSQTAVRAATLGLPLAIAVIGGMPERFTQLIDTYRTAAAEAGHDPASLPISINAHGFIANCEQQAVDDYYPSATVVMNRIGRERGWSPITQSQLEGSRTLRGADFVGTPDQIVEKILFQHEIFGHQRLLLQLGIGTIEHSKVMRAIELLGTKVAPAVRQALQKK